MDASATAVHSLNTDKTNAADLLSDVFAIFLSDTQTFFAISWPLFVQNCKFCFFVQNTKFLDFVRFSSITNFLCPYVLSVCTVVSMREFVRKFTLSHCLSLMISRCFCIICWSYSFCVSICSLLTCYLVAMLLYTYIFYVFYFQHRCNTHDTMLGGRQGNNGTYSRPQKEKKQLKKNKH